jgi:putative transcriptional regulator
MVQTKAGILLISDPFLKDEYFQRSVVLVCEHDEKGSFGFVLSHVNPLSFSELVEGIQTEGFVLYDGGPVGTDTLHFIHYRPDLIENSIYVADGIYWGGDFATIIELINIELLKPEEIKFFVGYSGWEANQLQEELDEKTWIPCAAKPKFVFQKDVANIWKDALQDMGGDYAPLSNYPLDPQLN